MGKIASWCRQGATVIIGMQSRAKLPDGPCVKLHSSLPCSVLFQRALLCDWQQKSGESSLRWRSFSFALSGFQSCREHYKCVLSNNARMFNASDVTAEVFPGDQITCF